MPRTDGQYFLEQRACLVNMELAREILISFTGAVLMFGGIIAYVMVRIALEDKNKISRR